jgi:hypothetical protein
VTPPIDFRTIHLHPRWDDMSKANALHRSADRLRAERLLGLASVFDSIAAELLADLAPVRLAQRRVG